MIVAKVHGYFPEGKGMLIQFSEPDETFKEIEKERLIVVQNEEDLHKRLHVKNKIYACSTLEGWLNQRDHATNSQSTITHLRTLIFAARQQDYEKACNIIANHKVKFEQLISEKSSFYEHYTKVIKPILEECENVHTGKAKVLYKS